MNERSYQPVRRNDGVGAVYVNCNKYRGVTGKVRRLLDIGQRALERGGATFEFAVAKNELQAKGCRGG